VNLWEHDDKAMAEARAWIERCPEGWALIKVYARQMFNNIGRVSIQAVVERYRWETNIAGSRDGSFYVNNNLRPGLARVLIEEHAEYADAIEIRQSRKRGAA
jgi:hypothetical protein